MDSKETTLFKTHLKNRVEESMADIDMDKLMEQFKDFCPSPQETSLDKAKQTIDELIKVVELTTPKPKTQEETEKEKRKQEMEQLNKLIQEANSKIKCDNKDINKYYERLRKSVEMVAKGFFNSTFLQSRTGLGKSTQVTSILNELGLKSGEDYEEFAGDISPAYIYKFVYENNGKIIIFRDTSRLIQELRSLDMLKAMTDTIEPRIVRRAIYRKDLDNLPPYFECKSRFVFEFNNLHFNGLKEDLDALLCRGDYVNLVHSMEDVANIMKQIAKTEEEREVTKFLIRDYKYVGMNALNLRTQQKAFQIYKYSQQNGDDWQGQIKNFLTSEMTPIRKMLYSLVGNRVVKTTDLKRLLVISHIDGVSHLRTADRRIRDWIVLRELFIVGFVCDDDEELEQYLNTHRNYAVCINPIEQITIGENGKISDIADINKAKQVKAEGQ